MSAWSILADENVDRAIVDRLRADGHDVEYIEEVAKSDADYPVLDRAIAEQRVLLTRDLDFGRYIYGDHLPAPSNGIIQLYQFRHDHHNQHRPSPGFMGLGVTANYDYRGGIRITY